MGNRVRIVRRSILAALIVLALGGAALALRPWAGRVSLFPTPYSPLPSEHWRQAEQALQAQDFPRAREHLEQCLASWPAHAATHFLLARACRRGDDVEAWQTHLRAAEALQWPAEEVRFERQLMQAQVGKLAEVEAPLLEQLRAGGGWPAPCCWEASSPRPCPISRPTFGTTRTTRPGCSAWPPAASNSISK